MRAASAPAPHLPGAVTQPPPWLDKNAPFDVAAFFAAPPPEQNAAPRYLDALFEFDSVMADCFPDGPDREGRKQAADERAGRSQVRGPRRHRRHPRRIQDRLPQARPGATAAAVRVPDRAGYHDGPSPLSGRTPPGLRGHRTEGPPGAGSRRDRRRPARCRTHLRLSRDLLPRGERIVGHVSSAIDVFTVKSLIVPLLTAPGLTIEHCDRLLALLLEHEARSVDAYAEGLRADYLSYRATWHDLIFDQGRLREHWARIGKPIGASSSIVAAIASN